MSFLTLSLPACTNAWATPTVEKIPLYVPEVPFVILIPVTVGVSGGSVFHYSLPVSCVRSTPFSRSIHHPARLQRIGRRTVSFPSFCYLLVCFLDSYRLDDRRVNSSAEWTSPPPTHFVVNNVLLFFASGYRAVRCRWSFHTGGLLP